MMTSCALITILRHRRLLSITINLLSLKVWSESKVVHISLLVQLLLLDTAAPVLAAAAEGPNHVGGDNCFLSYCPGQELWLMMVL
jgi:hypothetical protein